MKREFHVKTPMGDLHIYAKHENSDVMADYPGVYVELLREGCDVHICHPFVKDNEVCWNSEKRCDYCRKK